MICDRFLFFVHFHMVRLILVNYHNYQPDKRLEFVSAEIDIKIVFFYHLTRSLNSLNT